MAVRNKLTFALLAKSVLFIVTLAVAGCQGTNSYVGSGPIVLSPLAQVRLDSYLADPSPENFSVSIDGKNSAGVVCPYLECEFTNGTFAIRICEQRSDGVPCKVFATGKKIVWQGYDSRAAVTARIPIIIGDGSVTFSAKTQEQFEAYLNLPDPQYFAVTKDGASSGASYCGRQDPGCISDTYDTLAVSICQKVSQGEQCFIYAKGREVVWKGAGR